MLGGRGGREGGRNKKKKKRERERKGGGAEGRMPQGPRTLLRMARTEWLLLLG